MNDMDRMKYEAIHNLLKALNEAEVRYLVVGGFAVAAYAIRDKRMTSILLWRLSRKTC